jgi:hypothetical protein
VLPQQVPDKVGPDEPHPARHQDRAAQVIHSRSRKL